MAVETVHGMMKMTTKYLFKPPLLFLLLTHQAEGKSFLRAVLSILKDNPIEGVTLICEAESPSWMFACGPCTRQEQKWYELLAAQVPDAVHWWRQIGLNCECIAKDLQKLSVSAETSGGKAPLLKFKHEHPVLFECLHAVFGLMMSNSRLCEQIHGTMRASLQTGTDMDEADAQAIC